MNKHIMVDIESLGKTPGSIILSIGAVVFNPINGELGDEFYIEINSKSSTQAGLTSDASTLKWWSEQADDAAELLARCSSDQSIDLVIALAKFSGFIADKKFDIWANSPSFDLLLLEAAYKSVNAATPWKFWQERDCRTAVAIGRTFGIDPKKELPFEGIPHHALSDAKHQAKYVSAVFKSLELKSN